MEIGIPINAQDMPYHKAGMNKSLWKEIIEKTLQDKF
jgi:hypothetical protein